MEEKKVLLEAKIELTDALKEMATYEQKVREIDTASADLTKRIKAEGDANGVLTQQLTVLREQRKAYKKEIGELSRGVQNQIISEQKYEGTLKGLGAALSIAKDELRAMKVTDPGFAMKTKEVDNLNAKLKEMEAAYGVHTRNVGNYEGAVEKLKDEIRGLLQEMQELEASGQKGSDAYAAASDKFKDAKDQLGLINSEIPGVDNNMNKLNVSTIAAGTALSGLRIMQEMFREDSRAGEKLASTLSKLRIVIIAITALTRILHNVKKKNLLTTTAETIQTKGLIASIKLEGAAKSKNIIVSKAAAAAQWLLNKAMLANPAGLLIVGVAALGAGIAAMVGFLLSSTDAQKAATKAQQDYEKAVKKSEAAIAALDAEESKRIVNIGKGYIDEMIVMMKNGASKEALAKKEKQMQADLLKDSIETIQERIKKEEELNQAAAENYTAQKAFYEELKRTKGEDSKKTQEQKEKVEELLKTYYAGYNNINNLRKSLNESILEQSKMVYDAVQDATDKAYETQSKHLESVAKLQQTALKTANVYLYDATKSTEENNELRWKSELEYAAKSFNLQQEQEKNKLTLQRRYGKLTSAEYSDAMKQMRADSTAFYVEQMAQIEAHQRQAIEAVISLAGGPSTDEQIADLKKKYAEARETIKSDTTRSAEEIAFYVELLAQREAKDVKDIRLRAQDAIDKKIKTSIDEQYRYDTRQFSQSATEQIELAIAKQKQLIDKKKAAGLETFADDRQLQMMQSDLRLAQMNKEVQIAWRSSDEQYNIRKEYIDKELQLAELSAERRAALEEELANITIENNDRKIASFSDYANAVMDLASSMSELVGALGDAEVQRAEKENNAKKKTLDKRLKAGVISQKQYDKQTAALDEDLDAKKAKIARQQAIREKALGAMQIGINTATAIMKIWAEVPKFDFGASTIALTALVSAVGALQLATLLSTPIPVARKGGLIEGNTHEQGGVLVNTENDERIISAQPAKAFPELLNLISYIGKHSQIPDTGYAARALGTRVMMQDAAPVDIDYDLLAQKIGAQVSDSIKDLKIYSSYTEFREAEQLYTKMEQSAKI